MDSPNLANEWFSKGVSLGPVSPWMFCIDATQDETYGTHAARAPLQPSNLNIP